MYFKENQHEVGLDVDAHAAVEEGSNSRYHPQTSPCPASKLDSEKCVGNQMTAESSNSKTIGLASMSHSTLSDANFVDNYFKVSVTITPAMLSSAVNSSRLTLLEALY